MSSPLEITLGARMSAFLNSAEDYNKYRKKLNKTLLRLRHDLNLVTRDTKNYGSKEQISKIDSESYDKDTRYGDLILLTAERDLTFALEIKNLMEISGERVSSYRTLMISKLKRSSTNAKRLLSIVQNESDQVKKLEYFVYAALVQGLFSINKKRWSLAINAFSIARCGLSYLLSKANDQESPVGESEADNTYNKTLINELIDNLIDPSLNLALSQDESFDHTTTDLKSISQKRCHDGALPYLQPAVEILSQIDESFVSDVTSKIDLIDSVKWRDHEATLYNDELKFKIMKLNNKEETNWESFQNADQYDLLITQWSDLLQIHTIDVEKNQDEDDLDKVQDRAVLLTYINYNLLFTTLKRDLKLVAEKTSSHTQTVSRQLEEYRDHNKLYDNIIHTTTQLKDLPGVYNDEDLYDSLNNLLKYFEARKHVVLARSFSLVNKYPEALQIYHHIQTTLSESVIDKSTNAFYKIDDFPYDITSNEDFRQFSSELEKATLDTHILAQFSQELQKNGIRRDNFVAENINKFPVANDSLNSIINVHNIANISPVLSKPVLFDIGFNYIDYSSGSAGSGVATVTDELADKTNEDDGKKRGFFGIFGRS